MLSSSIKKKTLEAKKEHLYEKIFQSNDQMKPQFVCATQPLALLLSRDSFLCFDGDDFGLYYPWRGIQTDHLIIKDVDEDFKNFLNKKGAFIVPPIQEQRHLIQLYLDNVYSLYPVVDRNILCDIKTIPIMLLNAIFLSAIRFDTWEDKKNMRSRANEFYERCKLLELIETNKITLIQAFLLLSTHEEGIEGATTSKEFITKACNLCGELAITNIGGSNGIGQTNDKNDSELSSFKKVPYTKRLLHRLFWVSFCCDRLVSATSGREMYYNCADLMIDNPKLTDFDEGEHQDLDYSVFSSWCNICKLIERIQSSLYRPPQNRTTTDHTLEYDLLNWKIESPSLMKEIFIHTLQIYHAYAGILYLRCKVDSISLIVGNSNFNSMDEGITSKNIVLIHEYSIKIVDIIESNKFIHHVLIVHAILHVIALIQLESKMQPRDPAQKPSESDVYFNDMMSRSVVILENFKNYWWYAGAALRLCKAVISPEYFEPKNDII